MGKGRHPPKLLSCVLRTVAELHESKGSSVAHIADHIKKELTEHGRLRKNIALEIRRALKYAVDIGALTVKSGKYRAANKRRVIPVDSLEIVMDCRLKKAKRQKCAEMRKKRCQYRYNRKRGSGCVRDMHRKRKVQRRKVKNSKTAKRHKQQAKQAQQAKQEQQAKQQQQQEEPIKKRPPSATPSTEDDCPPIPNSAPGAQDRNQDLDRKKNRDNKDGRHQTEYPEYNDLMNGDDREDIIKVPGRPRRPRRPILPSGRSQTDGFSYFDDTANEKEVRHSCFRSLHLHREKVPRNRDRIMQLMEMDSMDEN